MENNDYQNTEYTNGRYETKKKRKVSKLSIVGIILLLVVLWGLSLATVVTYENQYTLIKQFGKVNRIIEEPGVSFKIPFLESESRLPKQIMIYDLTPSDVITVDKKTMVADSYTLWRIEDPLLFVQTLNSQVSNAESRINAAVFNSMKNVISSLSQAEVISGRDGSLTNLIMNNIGDSMKQYGIDLITVEVKRLDLPDDNKSAVYERMISERNNIAASYTAEGEAEATKIRTQTDYQISVNISEAESKAAAIVAEGEAEYMRILSEAYSEESRADFYTFVLSLDAAKKSLTGNNKTLILSADSPIAEIFNKVE
ncbi:MAG: protease modulator HflC [Lachnospiraceae bacterium]|nr:protease modulator HflC [Lachnospiraceae bacterium]